MAHFRTRGEANDENLLKSERKRDVKTREAVPALPGHNLGLHFPYRGSKTSNFKLNFLWEPKIVPRLKIFSSFHLANDTSLKI